MKKLLSLFAISSITLTAAGSSVACGASIKVDIYSYLPSGKNWDAGETFTVDFKSGTPNNIQLKDGDDLMITFFNTPSELDFYFDNSIKLGEAFVLDDTLPTFTITFTKSNMTISANKGNTVEIDLVFLNE